LLLAALQIAKKLDAHIIITSDHGEALGPALFHGIPPTPQLAEVPLATTIPTKIEGIISLTEIPHLILQAIRGQTPRLGQKIAKTEHHETPPETPLRQTPKNNPILHPKRTQNRSPRILILEVVLRLSQRGAVSVLLA